MRKLFIIFIFATRLVFAQESGVNEISNFDRLSLLRSDILSVQQSSHDPAGGNHNDGFIGGNFPDTFNGENVMLHVEGPGIVNRIWLTGYESYDKIKMYFDGESNASVDETVSSFFSGETAPYLSPLVVNDAVSSGGFFSYMPFPFEKSIMITTSGNRFYNINYQLYDKNNTDITSWTGDEDLSEVYTIFNNRGDDPRQTNDYESDTSTFNLPSGSTETAISIHQQNQNVRGVFLRVPELNYTSLGGASIITDDGKATTGYSQFILAIDPSADSVELVRRLDYWVADQKAKVYVDDVFAGEWYTEGSNGTDKWLDASFKIPSTFTTGKSQITIKIVFVSSMIDWNEFFYWIYCDGVLTDELDVGDADSESSHNYIIDPLNWSGSLSSEYPSEDSEDTSDDGRAFTGFSEFTMSISPDASEIKLIRKLDYCIGDQKANVFIDGEPAGEWFDQGNNCSDRWLDSEFILPDKLTTGESQITIKIEFVSGAIDWNEFYYWIYSDNNLTDELDVGNSDSETAHSYTIVGQTWEGSGDFTYPGSLTKGDNSKILDGLKIQMYYDGEASPSVDAPVGLFFGMGTLDAIRYQSLPVGVLKDTNQMYCYFPIPFESSFELVLINNSDIDLSDLEVIVNHEPLTHDFSDLGYFKTQYREEKPTTTDKDYIFLEESGSGKYVGMVLETDLADTDLWLEGDERFYIDDCRTPLFYGTGTEDYFNGAWYFLKGPFSLATHGYTARIDIDRSLYRFHLSDPVYFMSNIKLGIEHGPINDINANYKSLAFYYHQADLKFKLTDELVLGNTQSEQDHNYSITGSSQEELDKSYFFEGDEDKVKITESGYYIDGSSVFTVNIKPGKPVRIKRMFDYDIKNQTADVYVDDILAGTWYSSGKNSTKRWREEFFLIPAELTAGKSQMTLRFESQNSGLNWSEFHYWIYSIEPHYVNIDHNPLDGILIYPNPASTKIVIENGKSEVTNIEILDMSGKIIKQFKTQSSEHRIDISYLNEGIYLIKMRTDEGDISKIFIKE